MSAAGQRAVVRLDNGEGGEFDASVDQILEGESGAGKTIQLGAIWPEPSPNIGTPVQVIEDNASKATPVDFSAALKREEEKAD